jgi:hypothetical protein
MLAFSAERDRVLASFSTPAVTHAARVANPSAPVQ